MQVGDTVSLRVQTNAGPTEVVGTVLAAAPDTLTVRRRDGTTVDVAVTQITAGRVVPPSPAQRIDAAELHRIMAAGWRAAETEALGAWLLRADAGFTSRANSALAVGDPGLPLAAALERVEQWYDARRLPPRIQLPDRASPPGLTGMLDDRGWAAAWPTHVMTAELGPVLRAVPGTDQPIDQPIDLPEEPDDAWLAAYRPDEGHGGAAEQDVVALLTRHPDVVFASIRAGDRRLAIARVAVDGRWAGLSCVEVAADQRRRGLATAVSAAALRWAVSRGARRAYLQVTLDNTDARTLYERLGFTRHHDYVYRLPSNVDW